MRHRLWAIMSWKQCEISKDWGKFTQVRNYNSNKFWHLLDLVQMASVQSMSNPVSRVEIAWTDKDHLQMERSIQQQDHLYHKCVTRTTKFQHNHQCCISNNPEFHNQGTDMNCNKKKHSNNALQGLSKNRKLHRDHHLADASKTPIITADSKRSIWEAMAQGRDRLLLDQVDSLYRVKAKARCAC